METDLYTHLESAISLRFAPKTPPNSLNKESEIMRVWNSPAGVTFETAPIFVMAGDPRFSLY